MGELGGAGKGNRFSSSLSTTDMDQGLPGEPVLVSHLQLPEALNAM